MQVSPVTMSHPSPWLHPVCCYKRHLKEEEGFFGLYFGLFALGDFLPLTIGKKLLFGPFGVGSFWKGKC
jgi:hypothetical protein